MKQILSIVLIFCIVVPGSWSCKSIEELDECAYRISFLANRDMKVPSNDEETVHMCDNAKVSLKCISDEAKECSKGAAKAIFTKVMNDLEKHLHTRCDKAEDRAEFLKHVQCFQDPEKADALRLCSDKHMIMMEKVSQLPKELRLGGSCCSSHGFRECVMEKMNSFCPGESADYFENLISEVSEENLELVCKDFSSYEQCDSKYDHDTWHELKSILESDDQALAHEHHYKTILPIIMHMMNAK